MMLIKHFFKISQFKYARVILTYQIALVRHAQLRFVKINGNFDCQLLLTYQLVEKAEILINFYYHPMKYYQMENKLYLQNEHLYKIKHIEIKHYN